MLDDGMDRLGLSLTIHVTSFWTDDNEHEAFRKTSETPCGGTMPIAHIAPLLQWRATTKFCGKTISRLHLWGHSD